MIEGRWRPHYERERLCHLSGGSSPPAGSSGTGTGSTANVYNPTAQPAADQLFQQIVGVNGAGALPTSPGATPAATFYPLAAGNALSLAQGNTPYQNLLNAATYAGGFGRPALDQAAQGANLINQAAFDPQQALYNQTLNQVQQQSAAQNANSGLLGTPYGQSVANNATNQFNLGWQNQQLNREITGGQAAQSLLGSGLSNLSNAAGMANNVWTNQVNNYLNAATQAANIGNNQYLLPQQVANDLESYMGLGQSASQISGQLGLQGAQEQALALQEQNQALSGFGNLAGTGLSALSGGGGLSGLFGGGAAGGAASAAAAGGSALAGTAADAGAFGAADLLPAAALS